MNAQSAIPEKSLSTIALSLAIASLLAACGGGDGSSAPVDPVLPGAAPVVSTEQQTLPCPEGHFGAINQSRSVTTTSGVVSNGDWVTETNTCTASPSVSAARISSIGLAQSHLFLSTDSALVLIPGKQALVMVNVITTNTAQPKPIGRVRVETATGVLVREINLTLPTRAIPAVVPDAPAFTTAYSAVLPAELVTKGMQLRISLDNGQAASMVNPRIGGGIPMNVVAVPIQMGTEIGQVLAGAGDDLQAVMPVQSVNYSTRASYASKVGLPTDEAQWGSAMISVLFEMANLYALEGSPANTTYYGFLPKRTFGQVGLGFLSGNAAVGFDYPADRQPVMETMIHEIGHNLSLIHAPCGGPVNVDYPYVGGFLGAPGRYIWGYNSKSATFTDPRNTQNHDIMSYCAGTTFSDYNYRLMQTFITPTDKLVINAGVQAPVTTVTTVTPVTDALANDTHPLVVISGRLDDGKVQLEPVKSMFGKPKLLKSGPYVLRVVGDKGTFDYPFSPMSVDHDAKLLPFVLTIPSPGAILSLSIHKGGVPLIVRAPAASSAERQGTVPGAGVAAAISPAKVLFTENASSVSLSWDSARHAYLTVTHVGKQRMVLAQDLTGGRASVPVGATPKGGRFEFSLSDGLNSVLQTTDR